MTYGIQHKMTWYIVGCYDVVKDVVVGWYDVM